MNEFPRMVYKAGGPEEIHGGHFSTLIVESDDELDDALAKGWRLTTVEAKVTELPERSSATGTTGEGSGSAGGDNAPPTRDELKQKATELGLTFAGNISTDNLAALVDDALAKG